jgi:membrane-bound lytic murein transglycosylase D
LKINTAILIGTVAAAAMAADVRPDSYPVFLDLEDQLTTDYNTAQDSLPAGEFIEPANEGEAETIIESDRFEDLFGEAKIHYVNALIAEHFQDTVEVHLQIKLCLESLSDIEVFNNLDNIQYEELHRFTARLIEDFKDFAPEAKAVSEQFSVSDLRDMMDDYVDQSVDLGDQKTKIIEDRDGYLPIVLNARVQQMINFFQSRGRDNFQSWLNRKSEYESIFLEIIRKHDVPDDLIYLSMIESGFKTNAYSYARAMGQWQFMYYTGKIYGLKRDYWVDERMDFIKATDAAARHLKDLYDDFDDWYLAMAAYNAGAGRINRAIKREQTRDFWKMRLLPRETRNYVPTVMAAAIISKNPEEYGFSVPKSNSPIAFDTLSTKKSIELETIARICNSNYNELKRLNPELRKHSTPDRDYVLRIPKGSRDKLVMAYEKLESLPSVERYTHIVRRGESLYSISHKYNVPIREIMSANKLRNKQPILIGQKLNIPVHGSPAVSRTEAAKPDYTATHNKVIYRVKKGDTLGHIAEAYGTSASKIRSWNGLSYRQHIYPNQKLSIWTSKPVVQNGIYVVQSGDTLIGISQKTGISLAALKKLNPNINTSRIYPGDKINLNAAN